MKALAAKAVARRKEMAEKRRQAREAGVEGVRRSQGTVDQILEPVDTSKADERRRKAYEPDEAPGEHVAADACGAMTQAGTACKRPAGWGTKTPGTGYCRWHAAEGGNRPIRAEIVRTAQGGTVIADRPIMGLPIKITPEQAMMRAVWMLAGEVAYMSEKIAELDSPWEMTTVRTGTDDDGAPITTEVATNRLHPWIRERRKTLAQWTDAAEKAVKANVMQREAATAETLARVALATVEAVLDRLDLADGQRERVPALIDEVLIAAPGVDMGPKRAHQY